MPQGNKRISFPYQISFFYFPLNQKQYSNISILKTFNEYFQFGLNYNAFIGDEKNNYSANAIWREPIDAPYSLYRIAAVNRNYQYMAFNLFSHIFPFKDYPFYIGLYIGSDTMKNKFETSILGLNDSKLNYLYREKYSADSKSYIFTTSFGFKWIFSNQILLGTEAGIRQYQRYSDDKKIDLMFYTYRFLNLSDVYNSYSSINNEFQNRQSNGFWKNSALFIQFYVGIAF